VDDDGVYWYIRHPGKQSGKFAGTVDEEVNRAEYTSRFIGFNKKIVTSL